MKKYFKRSGLLHYKKGVPSKLNKAFYNRTIDAAFISSIKAKGKKSGSLGIVANREVKSVFVILGESKLDSESETSNVLAKVLGLSGEVIIGDKALKRYLQNPEGMIDLATAWYQKTKLPFVFGILCYNKGYNKKFEEKFLRTKVKIPQYILNAEAKSRGIKPQEILWYLQFISYRIGYKEKRSLKKFYKYAMRSSADAL